MASSAPRTNYAVRRCAARSGVSEVPFEASNSHRHRARRYSVLSQSDPAGPVKRQEKAQILNVHQSGSD